jgi:hypothetical protein
VRKINFVLIEAKTLQGIKTKFTLLVPYKKQNGIEHISISEAGYRSVYVL